MASVVWSEPALDDLEGICEFISRREPRSAELLARAIFGATERLGQFPLSGRVVPEFGDEQVREVVVGNYRIIYSVRNDVDIAILMVRHGARALDR